MNKYYSILAIEPGQEVGFHELESSAMQMSADRASEDQPDSKILSMHEGVGVIEIKGKLTNTNSWYNSWYGLVSYDEIRAAAVEAIELGAGCLLFDVDSPGGSVNGITGISSFIRSLDVPTVSHTSGSMSSAAYFIGASAETVLADTMSTVGSIGVILTVMEMSEAMKKAGYSVEVFRSGPQKQAGNPYEKLSAENKKYLQGQVLTLADEFYSFVSSVRSIPIPSLGDITTGRTYIGGEALTAGLIDVVATFDEALELSMNLATKTLDNENQNGNYMNYQTQISADAQGEDMKKTISQRALAALAKRNGELENGAEGTEGATAEGNEGSELTPEELAAQKAAAEGNEGSSAEGNEGEDTTDTATVELTEMTEKYDASQVELAEITEKLEAAEAEVTSLTEAAEASAAKNKEQMKPMVTVICDQIATMRVALSLSKVDMSDWAVEAIMTEYSAISKTFEASLPVGGVVPEESKKKSEVAMSREELRSMDTSW